MFEWEKRPIGRQHRPLPLSQLRRSEKSRQRRCLKSKIIWHYQKQNENCIRKIGATSNREGRNPDRMFRVKI